jgi:hypothetical protein
MTDADALLAIMYATRLFGLRAAGRLPLPIHLGRSVRRKVKEIESWVEANCPPLHQWQRMTNEADEACVAGSIPALPNSCRPLTSIGEVAFCVLSLHRSEANKELTT